MPADRRADGFLRVCRERGIEGEVLLSDRLSYGSMHYESYIEKGLLEHPETDGIFASSDLIAAQVLQRLTPWENGCRRILKLSGLMTL